MTEIRYNTFDLICGAPWSGQLVSEPYIVHESLRPVEVPVRVFYDDGVVVENVD